MIGRFVAIRWGYEWIKGATLFAVVEIEMQSIEGLLPRFWVDVVPIAMF